MSEWLYTAIPCTAQGAASCRQLLLHLCLVPPRALPQRSTGSSLLPDAVQVLRPQHAQVQDIARLFPGLTSLNLSGGCSRCTACHLALPGWAGRGAAGATHLSCLKGRMVLPAAASAFWPGALYVGSASAAASLCTQPFPLFCRAECQNVRNRNLLNLSRSKLRLQELRIGHMSSAPYGKPRITNQVSWLPDLGAACSGAEPEAGG